MQRQSPPPRAGEEEGGDKSCSLKPEAPSSPNQAPTRPCGSPALLQLTGGPCQRGPTCHSPRCHRPSEGGQAPATSGMGLYAHTAGACRAEAVGSHGQGRVDCWFQTPLVPLGALGASPRARLGLRIILDSGSRGPPRPKMGRLPPETGPRPPRQRLAVGQGIISLPGTSVELPISLVGADLRSAQGTGGPPRAPGRTVLDQPAQHHLGFSTEPAPGPAETDLLPGGRGGAQQFYPGVPLWAQGTGDTGAGPGCLLRP